MADACLGGRFEAVYSKHVCYVEEYDLGAPNVVEWHPDLTLVATYGTVHRVMVPKIVECARCEVHLHLPITAFGLWPVNPVLGVEHIDVEVLDHMNTLHHGKTVQVDIRLNPG